MGWYIPDEIATQVELSNQFSAEDLGHLAGHSAPIRYNEDGILTCETCIWGMSFGYLAGLNRKKIYYTVSGAEILFFAAIDPTDLHARLTSGASILREARLSPEFPKIQEDEWDFLDDTAEAYKLI